jgi:hypothetical protein
MINFVTLKAADIEETANVFRAVGLEFTQEQHGSGPVHLPSTNCALVVEIYPAKGVDASGVMIGIEVTALRNVAEKCEELGVTIRQGIAQAGDFQRMILQTPESADIFVHESSAKIG